MKVSLKEEKETKLLQHKRRHPSTDTFVTAVLFIMLSLFMPGMQTLHANLAADI